MVRIKECLSIGKLRLNKFVFSFVPRFQGWALSVLSDDSCIVLTYLTAPPRSIHAGPRSPMCITKSWVPAGEGSRSTLEGRRGYVKHWESGKMNLRICDMCKVLSYEFNIYPLTPCSPFRSTFLFTKCFSTIYLSSWFPKNTLTIVPRGPKNSRVHNKVIGARGKGRFEGTIVNVECFQKYLKVFHTPFQPKF